MDLGLRGKVALVSGASRGLGRAIAETLAAEGALLVICARGADALEKARQTIAERTGVDVDVVAADVATDAGIALVRQHTRDRFGRGEALLTKAVGPPPGAIKAHGGD